MPDRYAVIGNPVAHSKSPWIHARFARQTGEDLQYAALAAPLDGFAQTVNAFRQAGGKGANVTLPFKEEAYRLAPRLSARAAAAQAVNTLLFSDGEIRGDNTDGCGLTHDLAANLGFAIAHRRVLLIGAGGAARGVLLPLIEAGPATLVIANRSVEKARLLAGRLSALPASGAEAAPGTQPRACGTQVSACGTRVSACGTRVSACGFGDLAGERFDLVINATSAGLTDTPLPLPSGIFAPGALAYEMVYGRDTEFLRQARAGGAAQTADGLGMLVEQAAESFFLWRGLRPQTAPVLEALRAA